ncbi:MAG TPA: formate dehydrogenase accessory protein FdhE [Candidatus Dormibacteraeota bacterium]|nr:formate dehydrogenase accessory protein FdhE [Candidatus Dormibacteraeota bacterium]
MTAQPDAQRSPYADRRRRAHQLRERYPFAAEVLTLYAALLDVQEPAFEAARGRPAEEAAGLAHDLVPRVLDVTVAAGPPRLAEALVGRFHSSDLDDVLGRWPRGAEQSLVDRYLARACWAPVLEAMDPGSLLALCPGPRDARHCPRCGGPPQVAFFALSGEELVTGPRHLLCARCAAGWTYPRMVCAGCGEATSNKLPVYSDSEQLPHIRIDACETCQRYVLGVDMRRDATAVPVVDELAALPLDLYAKERGLSKVAPNLMGF